MKPFCAVDAERSDGDNYEAVVARWMDEGLLVDRGEGAITRSVDDARVRADDDPIAATTPMRRGRSWIGPTLAGALTAVVIACLAYLLLPAGDERVDTSAGDDTAGQQAAGPTSTTTDIAAAAAALDFRGITPVRPKPDSTGPRPADTSPNSPLTVDGSTTTASSPTSTIPASTTAATSRATSGASASASQGQGSTSTSTSISTATSTTQAPIVTSNVPTTPATTAVQSCSGGRWKLVVEDNFDGTNIDTGIWQALDGTGHNGNGLRRPTAIWVANGTLNITAKMQDGQLVSGGLVHRHNQTYGRYEIRVRTDVDPSGGMGGSVFTEPQASADGRNQIYRALDNPANAAVWHTIVMEWTPDSITITEDGNLVKTSVADSDSDAEADGDGDGTAAHHAAIRFDATGTTIPHDLTMQVDYIRIDSYQAGC